MKKINKKKLFDTQDALRECIRDAINIDMTEKAQNPKAYERLLGDLERARLSLVEARASLDWFLYGG